MEKHLCTTERRTLAELDNPPLWSDWPVDFISLCCLIAV